MQAPKKKILIVVTNHSDLGNTGRKTGYWLGEVAHPYLVLRNAGYHVDFISPKGGEAPMDPGSRDLNDEGNKRFAELDSGLAMSDLRYTLEPDMVDPFEYCAIIFAGGHGTMWDFPDSKGMQRIARAIYEQGGVVAAVCHGPSGIVNLRLSDDTYLVSGKKVTGFSNEEEAEIKLTEVVPFSLEDKLRERGAVYEKAEHWQSHVVVCDRLVTGQNPQSARALGEAVVTALGV
jgi:putative intracellular protease/amidase